MARPRSDIAPRILEAARQRFLAEGVDGASLRRIARDARTNIGMVYYYFPTKDDLFLAVVEEVYGRVLGDFEAALAPDTPVEERLRRFYARVGRMTEDESVTMRIVIREVLTSSERRARILERFSRGHIPLLLHALADGVSSGTLRSDLPPAVLTMASFALAFLPQLLRRLVGDAFPLGLDAPKAEDLSHALAEILFHGIAARRDP